MVRKLLLAAFLAAFAVAGGGAAFGADVYYTGGGGGGGGGGTAGTDAKAGGDGGKRSDAGNSTNNAAAGDGASAVDTVGDNGGDSNAGGGSTGQPAQDSGVTGGRGGGGQNLGAADSRFAVDYNGSDDVNVLGGDGGEAGVGGSAGRGGAGGKGGDAFVNIVNAGTGNLVIQGGAGNDGAVTVNSIEGGRGGAGGNVDVTAGALSFDSGKSLTVQGGAAGKTTAATDGDGGNGGNASLSASTITLDNAEIAVINGAVTTQAGSEGVAGGLGLGGNASFSVGTLSAGAGGGSFTTANGEDASVVGTGKRTINIGALNAIAGNMALDFETFDFDIESMSIGTVTVGDAATTAAATVRELEVDNGTLNMAENWNGVLNVFGVARLGGVDLTGANVTVDVQGLADLDVDTDVLLKKGTGDLTVAADTTVAVKVNADQKTAIIGDGSTTGGLKVFDNTVIGVDTLEDKAFTIWSGAEKATATFDDEGALLAADAVNLVFAADATEDGAAYNALLAAPALMSLVNGGADAAEKAAGSFSPMAFANNGSGAQFGVFANMGAASIDVDTGSGVDSDSFHMLIGPGLRINNGTGKTDFGAFFEAGWGGYDAYSGVYRGDGDTEYYGGGLLLRHDTCFGLYGEASLRIGGADTDYHNLDGLDTDYDMSASYVGGHLGIGYILRPNDCTSWDFFAKGIMTSVSDESAEDKAGNTITVDRTDSFRTQLGAKYSYNFGQNASFFVKGAWEHEFDGETGGMYNATRIAKNADSSGSSVLGELGVDIRVTECVSLGASVYGIAGQREGFGGNVSLGIGF